MIRYPIYVYAVRTLNLSLETGSLYLSLCGSGDRFDGFLAS